MQSQTGFKVELQFVSSGLLMKVIISVAVHDLVKSVHVLGEEQYLTLTTLMDTEEDVAYSGE